MSVSTQSTEKSKEHQVGHRPDVQLYHDAVAPEAIGGRTEELPRNYYMSMKFIGTLTATCLAQICGYVGWVLPANTLSLISAELGVNSNTIWLAVAWQMGLTVGFLWVGRLSDIFGRRWFFTSACIIGLIGNIIAAAAQNVNMILAANCLNGLAAGPQLSFSVVMGELVPMKRRGTYNTFVLFTSVPFAVFGPPIARAFYEHSSLTFRCSYIMGAVFNAVAVVLYIIFYHPPRYQQLHVGGKEIGRQLATFDWVGFILFTAGMCVFLIGLNWGGSVYPWSSGHVLGAFFTGLATLGLFCVWEAFCGIDYPLMPIRLWRNLKYDAIVVVGCTACMPYYAFTVLWPTMVGALFTSNVEAVGWRSCAVGGGYVIGQLLGGFGFRYIPKMRWQMLACGVLLTTFHGALAVSNPSTESMSLGFFIIGMFAGGYIENLVLSAMALVWEPHDIGLVSGVLCALRTAGGALATSMYSAILATKLTHYLPEYVAPAALKAGLPKTSLAALLEGVPTQTYTGIPGVNAKVLSAIAAPTSLAYTKSFRTVWLTTIAFGCITIIAAFFTPNVEDYLTEDVARKLQGYTDDSGGSKDAVDEVERGD